MSIVDSLKLRINQGRKGLNKGISMLIPGLDEKIYGLQRGWIYTILGGSSSGKTSFILYSGVYAALKDRLEDENLNIIYYSLEMSSEVLFSKLASFYIWDTFGKCISYSEMMSMGKVISDEDYYFVEKSYEWLEKVEKRFIVYNSNKLNADDMESHLSEYFSTKGKFEYNDNVITYKPNNPNAYHIAILDHVKLLSFNGNNVKPEIDKACKVAIFYRNICNLTFVFLQQQNRNAQDMNRKAAGLTELQLNDAQDTSDTIQASDVVLGIYFPSRENVSNVRGYNVKRFKDKLRLIQIMKNRYGQLDISMGTAFYGKIGYWKQLPVGEDMTEKDYEYFVGYIDGDEDDNVEKQSDTINKVDKNKEADFSFKITL